MGFTQFEPGQSHDGEVDIDLTKGFSWVAWLCLYPTSAESQTIWAVSADGPAILKLSLDAKNAVNLRVEDKIAKLPPHIAAQYFGRGVMVAAYAQAVTGKLKLQLEFDNKARNILNVPYNGPQKLTKQVIGGGQARFGVGEMIGYPRILDKEERAKHMSHFKAKHSD